MISIVRYLFNLVYSLVFWFKVVQLLNFDFFNEYAAFSYLTNAKPLYFMSPSAISMDFFFAKKCSICDFKQPEIINIMILFSKKITFLIQLYLGHIAYKVHYTSVHDLKRALCDPYALNLAIYLATVVYIVQMYE